MTSEMVLLVWIVPAIVTYFSILAYLVIARNGRFPVYNDYSDELSNDFSTIIFIAIVSLLWWVLAISFAIWLPTVGWIRIVKWVLRKKERG